MVGSAFLALGTQLQNRGVRLVARDLHAGTADYATRPSLRSLIRQSSWLLGTLLLALAVLLQLGSLAVAPLTVVQPIGAVALVFTAVLHARHSRTRMNGHTLRAVAICVGGIGVFVGVATTTTTSTIVTDRQLASVLVLLVLILIGLGVTAVAFRRRIAVSVPIVVAGVLFGFVATLAKILLDRAELVVAGGFDWSERGWLTGAALAGLILATGFGSYLVQVAHSTGPPDLVVAGLTVIDPLVGVTIGIMVLGEATSAPPWALIVFIVAGAVAALGVVDLARRHVPASAA